MIKRIMIFTALLLSFYTNKQVLAYDLLFGHNYAGYNRVDLYDTETSQMIASPFMRAESGGLYTSMVTDVEISPDGYVYVGSQDFGSIYRFSMADGSLIDLNDSVPGMVWRESWSRPMYFASDPETGTMYWSNNYMGGNTSLYSVYKYDVATKLVTGIVNPPDKSSANLRGLALSRDGSKLYVAARLARDVRVYDTSGNWLYTHDLPVEQFPGKGPESLVFGPEGYLYVNHWDEDSTAFNESQITIWDVSSEPWVQVGTIDDGINYYTGALHWPLDMEFSPDGKLYVGNRDKSYTNSKVLIFENDGQGYDSSNWTKSEGPAGGHPFGLCFTSGFKCGDPGTVYLPTDVSGQDGNRDCRVDIFDFAELAKSWLIEN